MKYLILPIIRLYKRFVSKGLSTNCRYTPTCSIYSMQALDEWGGGVGSLLTLYRLLRCNPFSKGGYDPVPKRKAKYKWLI